jgi:hypothetical protein
MTPPGIELTNFRLVAQCLNHYATACPPTDEWSFGIQLLAKVEKYSFNFYEKTDVKIHPTKVCQACVYRNTTV